VAIPTAMSAALSAASTVRGGREADSMPAVSREKRRVNCVAGAAAAVAVAVAQLTRKTRHMLNRRSRPIPLVLSASEWRTSSVVIPKKIKRGDEEGEAAAT